MGYGGEGRKDFFMRETNWVWDSSRLGTTTRDEQIRLPPNMVIGSAPENHEFDARMVGRAMGCLKKSEARIAQV
jgi:hypothetical protein